MQSAISWNDLTQFKNSPPVRKYEANNILLFQGEVPPFALLVQKGYVVSYTINDNGDEQIVAFFSVGDILPVGWIFNKSPVSLYYCRAFTDCEVIAVSREALLEQTQTDIILSNKLVAQFASSLVGTMLHVHALEHPFTQGKIVKLLYYLVIRFGIPADREGTYQLAFKLTHAQIASMVGASRESVATEAMKLKKQGVILYENGFYTVHLSQLLVLFGSEEFNDIHIQSFD